MAATTILAIGDDVAARPVIEVARDEERGGQASDQRERPEERRPRARATRGSSRCAQPTLSHRFIDRQGQLLEKECFQRPRVWTRAEHRKLIDGLRRRVETPRAQRPDHPSLCKLARLAKSIKTVPCSSRRKMGARRGGSTRQPTCSSHCMNRKTSDRAPEAIASEYGSDRCPARCEGTEGSSLLEHRQGQVGADLGLGRSARPKIVDHREQTAGQRLPRARTTGSRANGTQAAVAAASFTSPPRSPHQPRAVERGDDQRRRARARKRLPIASGRWPEPARPERNTNAEIAFGIRRASRSEATATTRPSDKRPRWGIGSVIIVRHRFRSPRSGRARRGTLRHRALNIIEGVVHLLPSTNTTAMIRPAMAATMRPYSTAVAPSSSLNSLSGILEHGVSPSGGLVRSFRARIRPTIIRAPSRHYMRNSCECPDTAIDERENNL